MNIQGLSDRSSLRTIFLLHPPKQQVPGRVDPPRQSRRAAAVGVDAGDQAAVGGVDAVHPQSRRQTRSPGATQMRKGLAFYPSAAVIWRRPVSQAVGKEVK